MRRFLGLRFLCLLPLTAFAQDKPTVSIDSQPNIHFFKPVEEYLVKAYSRIGYRVNLIALSPGRSAKMAKSGELDGLAVRVEEIANTLDMIKVPVPLISGDLALYCQASVICELAVLDNPELVIGTLGGLNLTTQFMKQKKASTYQIADGAQLTDMFAKGRLDYILTFEIGGQSLFRTGNNDNILVDNVQKQVIRTVKGYHLVQHKHHHLVEALTISLKAIIHEQGHINDNLK
ncbi:hypothetical protein ACFSJY_11150 [Thalassotalea euphylliae]|uniref:hypothetical protein n=1 Tax=Thalassotalea euphylliae TaxID=1655234 RepID=UPI0036271A6F